jgi:CheY-like chemotaxis protein
VLIVEDDEAVATATALLLGTVGCATWVASGAEEAHRLLAEQVEAPDVLICDFHLGNGVDGIETIAALRDLAQRPIPAILITADTSAATLCGPAQIEDCRLLRKPVDADELLGHVQRLLGAAV